MKAAKLTREQKQARVRKIVGFQQKLGEDTYFAIVILLENDWTPIRIAKVVAKERHEVLAVRDIEEIKKIVFV